jgi:hypothetical protein
MLPCFSKLSLEGVALRASLTEIGFYVILLALKLPLHYQAI